jgi:glycerol uptake facilitator-like aquaporin
MLLASTVVGSGVMAENLAGGNIAIALLANTFATIGTLFVIIKLFAPISGAHFNPAVTFIMALRGQLARLDAIAYVVVQIVGCCAGTWLAHLMFLHNVFETSMHDRSGASQLLSEAVATFGLLLVVLANPRPKDDALLVAAWIGAAYWFTASTSFANPAITIARALSNTFAGIRPADAPGFVVAQFVGASLALWVVRGLLPRRA